MRLLRLLLAWKWLQWRSLANALSGRRRSGGGRFSAWLGLVLTVVFGLVGTGFATALAVGGWFIGRALAAGDVDGPALVSVRIAGAVLLALVTVLTLVAAGRSAAGDWTRLLLLPVERRDLHVLELLAELGEPWLLVITPALLTLAVGFGAGDVLALLTAVLAGGLFYLAMGAFTALLSLLAQLLLRDRRRAELVALLFLVGAMALGWLPGVLDFRDDGRHRRSQAPSTAPPGIVPSPRSPSPRSPAPRSPAPAPDPVRLRHDRSSAQLAARVERWLQPIPSEAYAGTLRAVAGGQPRRAALPLAILATEAALLYALSGLAWRRLVGSPALGSHRRRGMALPRLASPTSLAGHPAAAVARVQVRTVLRTVQGRLAVFMPLLVTAAVTITAGRHEQLTRFAPMLGATAVLGLGPLSVFVWQAALLNQFGVDGAGFSLQVLSPLGERDIVLGRALGGTTLTFVALLPALLLAMALHSSTPLLLWPATLLGGLAAYLLFAPAAVWLSLLFPKTADLSKLGQKGKPHGAAALLGVLMLSVSLGLVQVVGLVGYLLAGAGGALLGEALLAGAAAAISWPLLVLAASALPARRDALLLALRAG